MTIHLKQYAPIIHVRQYRPAFFEGFDNWEGDVETREELLTIPFIKRWSDGEANPDFTRLSLSPNAPDPPICQYNLMAEIRGNEEWWVVAILKIQPGHPILEQMPEWVYPKTDPLDNGLPWKKSAP